MRAFEHAVGLGYRYLETDVQATADGVPVVFHDHALDRVTDRTGDISQLPWSEVQKARVAGTEPIPLLEDLLGAWPEMRVNIEPKRDESVGPLVDVIRRTAAIDRVCLGAFSDRRLARLRAELGPRLCTSLGPRGLFRLRLASFGAAAGHLPAACAQVPTRYRGVRVIDPCFVRAAHRRGIAVHVWTIDDADEMHRLLDLGVDGLMTDRPTVLRRVLEERGEWVAT